MNHPVSREAESVFTSFIIIGKYRSTYFFPYEEEGEEEEGGEDMSILTST